jgi:uncharacterized membrane protein HdeD (DUF308 family)
MTAFTMIVILGVLMILGGISLMSTPLITFMSAGYYIIILFFIEGLFGIIRGIHEKKYGKEFFLAVLSLILGIVGLAVPGAAEMSNYVLLYMAAGWFIFHGILSIVNAIKGRKEGDDFLTMVLGIILGVLELALAIYSIICPTLLAFNLGMLIGFYFIESGISTIVIGKATCSGGNNLTILYTVMGVLTIIGGISMLATPLLTYLGTGPCIIMLFFINGVVGIIRGISEHNYDKGFFFAILSLVLGIIGVTVPGIAEMNSSILLYMAAGWFFIHGAMTIINAIASKEEAGTGGMVLGIILGVLELIMGGYSVAHPAVLALSIGLLIGFYFIESGANMIFTGSKLSAATAISRAQ